MSQSNTGRLARASTLLTIAAAWCTYLPIGLQYLAMLGLGVTSVLTLKRAGRFPELAREPILLAATAFLAWLVVTAAWTSGSAGAVASHLWSYSLLLWVAPIALACQSRDADRALTHFLIASALIASLLMAQRLGDLFEVAALRPLVNVTGNRRIAYSLLLALASALAVLRTLRSPLQSERIAWAACAAMCTAGLALQDRRSGMLLLPVLLVVVAWSQPSTRLQRGLAVAAVLVGSVLAWGALEGVQQRFREGTTELREYTSDADVSTSWGMRARMAEVTLAMVRERPIAGHGVGSWPTVWRERVVDGVLAGHTTPHSEYLLIAAQAGAVGLALVLLVISTALFGVWRRGADAQAIALSITTIIVSSAFNSVLRDTKFSIPLLTLVALCWASERVRAPKLPQRSSTIRHQFDSP